MRALGIVFLSSSLLIAGCSGDKSRKSSVNGTNKKPEVSRTNTPTQIKPFLDDKESGAQPGQIVFFNDVRIEPGPTDNAVYAVGPNGGKMLVVLNEPLKPSQNSQARFDVKGAVERTPCMRLARTAARCWWCSMNR